MGGRKQAVSGRGEHMDTKKVDPLGVQGVAQLGSLGGTGRTLRAVSGHTLHWSLVSRAEQDLIFRARNSDMWFARGLFIFWI